MIRMAKSTSQKKDHVKVKLLQIAKYICIKVNICLEENEPMEFLSKLNLAELKFRLTQFHWFSAVILKIQS